MCVLLNEVFQKCSQVKVITKVSSDRQFQNELVIKSHVLVTSQVCLINKKWFVGPTGKVIVANV